MRRTIAMFTMALILAGCSNSGTESTGEHKHDPPKPTADNKKSLPAEEKKWVGNAEIKINYHSPAVRGRVIWGGLVPYNAVWVTGAHNATAFEVGKDFEMGDKIIPAGKYALFTIPGKEEWTVILNKNWNQHLADDYSEADDVMRVQIKPEATEQLTERLTYEIDQTGERSANIIISWEKIRLSFPLEIR